MLAYVTCLSIALPPSYQDHLTPRKDFSLASVSVAINEMYLHGGVIWRASEGTVNSHTLVGLVLGGVPECKDFFPSR